jgi:glycosyltransferase involved in cell wall biosynthesis
MSSKEMAQLYKNEKIKCLVSATRGEGYGLPLVDAAASGMPVITTNWSGHLEFLSSYRFLPIDYKMKKIPDEKIDNRIFLEGFRWAEPNKQSFFDCIDNLQTHYETIKVNCLEDSELIRQNFCKQNIKKMYDKVFEGLF